MPEILLMKRLGGEKVPELPEVETTLRGIKPYVVGARMEQVVVWESRLRWPIPGDLPALVRGGEVLSLSRRGKYLLFSVASDVPGTMLVHLGMSGSLRLAQPGDALRRHDHLQITLSGGRALRFHDPRRFGSVLWHRGDPSGHKLLSGLGPEPLSPDFNGAYLYQLSRQRKMAVKQFLMDSSVVVGVGNIYANEALSLAGISPVRRAGRVSLARYLCLAEGIKQVLTSAIEQGGTTLRDFVNGSGAPGYFQQQLQVYGRGGQPCKVCGRALKEIRLGQRATVYCSNCQR